MTEQRPHVVIVGAGFAGIKAAKMLSKEAVDVTIIDRENFHLFQPLLYQVSTAVLATDEIAYPIRAFFRDKDNVELFMAKAEGLDAQRQVVITNHGEIKYDYLILCAGATTNYFGMKSVEENTYGMKTIQEALHIRNHVLHMFERANKEMDPAIRRRMLTFICVGGGPTGVEEAGAIAELVRVQKQEFHNLNFDEVSIKLIEATDKVLPSMPEKLRAHTIKTLQEKGVDVMLNTQVVDCDKNSLTLKNGTVIPTNTVIWAAGVRSVKLVAELGAEVDRAGRIIVNRSMQVPGYPNVFAAGDCAHFTPLGSERALPTIAPVATQGAALCARNIMHLIHGVKEEELDHFVYKDYGGMATIGRCQAVVSWGIIKMTGFSAWCIWMFLHLLRLESAHADVTVGIKWLWNFVSGTRLGRIITNIHREDVKHVD